MGQNSSTNTDDDSGNFTALWLDAEVRTNSENKDTEKRLRTIFSCLKTFDNKNLCEKYIQSASAKEKLLLITSGRLGSQLVPQIHDLPQVAAIYVFCKDKKVNEQWAVNFTKIHAVLSRVNDLISRIETDRENLQTTSVPSSAGEIVQPLGKSHSPLIFSYLLSNALLRMKPTEKDKSDLISLCKNMYKDNKSELKNIDEFQRDYTRDKAIGWYTRYNSICIILNKALRTQDIDTIFLYQFFIHDLHQQIAECQCRSRLRVYRGQAMEVDEINRLKESVGSLMSFNCFLSSTPKYETALRYTQYSPTDRHRVIWEIEADPEIVKTRPFGDITKYSEYPQECEILFSIGSLFRITSVQQESDGLWKTRMTLCGDNDLELKLVAAEMKNNYGFSEGEAAFVSFSRVLREMKKFDEAENYCHRLLEEFASKNSVLGLVYLELAEIASAKNDPSLSDQWHNKAMASKKKAKMDSLINSIVDKLPDDRDKTDSMRFLQSSSEKNFRFTDILAEKHEILLPIEGYEKMPLVSLEEAIQPLISILPDIRRKAHTAKLRCKEPEDGLTPDQSAAIVLYTMEWEPRDQCLYFALNARLRTAERNSLKPWFLYLKLILTGLARLPSIERTVYRGVKLDLTSKHFDGQRFFWWGFSSCTTTMNALKAPEFLGNSGTRTFFLIDCVHGKDIRNHSYYTKEEEILLLPAIYLEVKSSFQMAPDLHVIQLKEIVPEYPYLEPVDEQQ